MDLDEATGLLVAELREGGGAEDLPGHDPSPGRGMASEIAEIGQGPVHGANASSGGTSDHGPGPPATPARRGGSLHASAAPEAAHNVESAREPMLRVRPGGDT